MLSHRDNSMAVGGIERNDISVIQDDYSHRQRYNRESQRELDEVETSKTRQCLKKTAKFLFSHIGLVGLVVVYSVAGGFLFQLLELHQDKLNCQEAAGEQKVEITKLKQKIVAYIQFNVSTPSTSTISAQNPTTTYSLDKDNATTAYATIGAMLTDYRDFVIETGAKYRYYGENCSDPTKWTFLNSLLFAITIITTIGYGNITPVTWEGQICCICYATIGIPIFLLCVANISGVLGEMFRFLYAKILCKPCNMIKKRRAMARKAKLEEESGMNISRVNTGGWSMDDHTNDNSMKKSQNGMVNEPHIDEDEQQRNQRVTVPLTITMLIIAAYIWAGSMIFNKFEQWTMTQAGYFCFITLATIGFGDFVPGQQKGDDSAKLILGAIYVLFGMAILAMCFDLMQEEIVAKFRWIGRKVGIIEKDEDPNANQNDKSPNNNNNNTRRGSTSPSTTEPNAINNPNGKINDDDDNDMDWPTQRSNSSGTRKLSPRNNIARVHPVSGGSNEGTLHQRTTVTKLN